MTEKMQLYSGTEYIQPPPGPPTLDATKSPLALLAQTCSSIGKETSSMLKISTKFVDTNGKLRKTSLPALTHSYFQRSTSSSLSDEKITAVNRRKLSPKSCGSSPISESYSLSRDGSCLPEKKGLFSQNFQDRMIVSEEKSKKGECYSSPTSNIIEKKKFLSDNSCISAPICSTTRSPTLSSATFERKLQTSLASCRPLSKSCSSSNTLSGCGPYCSGYHPSSGCHPSPRCHPSPTTDTISHCQLYLPFGISASTYPLYAQMLMAAASRSASINMETSQHVCHWVISGNKTCGKRFSTGEDLLCHLQTHTLTSSNNCALNYFMNSLDRLSSAPYAAYLSQQAAALAAVAPASSIGRNMLTQAHGSQNKFHPYKANALTAMTNASPVPIAAGVSPYSSPFHFYGSRLEPAAAAAAAAAFTYL